MKRNIIIAVSLFFTSFLFGQDQLVAESIVDTIFNSLEKKNYPAIQRHLSEDFQIGNYNTTISQSVLQQLSSQLGKVEDFTLQNTSLNNGELKLEYAVKYARSKDYKNAYFIFDNTNKISSLNLLKIQVQTMRADEVVIEYDTREVIEIPFTVVNKFILVKAKINGVTRDFVLDSGAAKSMINNQYLPKRDKDEESFSDSKGVNGYVSGMKIEKMDLEFYGSKMIAQKVLTIDLSHLERDRQPIYGLIGYDFLKKYDVLLDYEKGMMTLIKPSHFEKFKTARLASEKLEVLPFHLRGHIPVIPIKVKEKTYWMGLDTGASVGLFDQKYYNNLQSCLKNIERDTLKGADENNAQFVETGELKKFRVGKYRYKKNRFVFSDISHLNANKEMKIDGLLGYAFLSKRRILISYHREELLWID